MSAVAVDHPTVATGIAANEALARGNLQLADYLCREVLAQAPDDVVALSVLGHLATGLRRFRIAQDCYARALAARPQADQLRLWHDRSTEMAQAWAAHRAAAQRQPAACEKFLLIKAWGYGFWSDMDHVLGQLLVAELTDRTPVVHWGSNTLFGADGVGNAFELYFQPLSDATLASVEAAGATFFPPKWTPATLRDENLNKFTGPGARTSSLHLLARDEDVVVSDYHGKLADLLPWIEAGSPFHGLDYLTVYRRLVEKYIRLQPALAARIDAFRRERMGTRRWMAVHVRGSDKVTELRDLALVNTLYHRRIEARLQADPALGIFLLTDSEHFAREYQGLYGDRVLTADVARSADTTGVHYAGHEGRRLGEEVLVDTHLAACCDHFLGNGASNVSTAVRHLKTWVPGSFELIGPDFLTLPNPTLHRW